MIAKFLLSAKVRNPIKNFNLVLAVLQFKAARANLFGIN